MDKVMGFHAGSGDLEVCRAVLAVCRGCPWIRSPAMASQYSQL